MTRPDPGAGAPAAGEDPAPLLEQMGGVSGLVASTVPVAVLVPVNAAWGLGPALAAAVAVALGVFLWRLSRRETLQPAVSGLFAVLIGAGIAFLVGDAKGYFLYGIWYSAVAAVAFAASMLLRRPAVGLIWEGISGRGAAWLARRRIRGAYQVATGAWTAVFAARFAVQQGFYNAGDVTWLGIARILMGWPLTGLVLLVTVWAIRRARALEEAAEAGGAAGAPAAEQGRTP